MGRRRALDQAGRPRLARVAASTCALAVVLAGCGVGRGASDTATDSRAESTATDGSTSGTTTRDGGVRAYVFSSLARLQPSTSLDAAGSDISLRAARGEREGTQLVVTSDAKRRVSVRTQALRGPGRARIPAAAVQAYIEHAVRVEQGSPAGRSGVYHDALLPAAGRERRVDADTRMVAWVDVAIPRGAAPGRYDGHVEIRSAGDVVAKVPLRVHVDQAVLPERPLLGSSIGTDASQIARFEGTPEGSSEIDDMHERYFRLLADARQSAADPSRLIPGAGAGAPAAGSPEAAYMERWAHLPGSPSVRLPFYASYPFEDPLGRDRPAAVAYLRGAAAWLRSEGLMDRSYVFIIDEPDRSQGGEVREFTELVHEADPQLRMLLTSELRAEFNYGIDIWTPNVGPPFRPADVARVARAGAETWWYPSITSYAPHPTLFIDDLRPSGRALGWLAWRYRIRGMLYWTATHWQEVEDPYREPGTYRETDAVGNGDGSLVYPGRPAGVRGPVPSVRLLQLRDGSEEFDLLALAACARGTAAADAIATRLAPSMTSFVASARTVDAARLQLLAAARDADPRTCALPPAAV